MKPWLIYTRVSTDEQAKEGVSLEAQRRSCEAMLAAQGVTSTELIVDDGYSGRSLRRPGLTEVLARCQRGSVAGVCVYALDRLTRSRRDIHAIVEALESGGAALVGVRDKIDTTGPSGRFVLHLLVNLANLEIEQTGERVRMAMREIKGRGGHAHQAPAGTVLVRGEDRIPRLAPHQAHGPVVAQVWPLLSAGRSLADVASHLDASVPTKNGKPWTKAAVHYLASNRNYLGVLVDQQTFDAAGRVLQSRRRDRRPDTTSPVSVDRYQTALAGLCYCQRCGSALVQVSSRRQAGTYVYLRCSGRLKRGAAWCAAKDVPAKPVEDIVLASLQRWLADGTIAKGLSDWMTRRTSTVAAAAAKVPEIRLQRDAIVRKAELLMEVIEEGGRTIPSTLAAKRLAAFQAQIDEIDATIQGLASAEATTYQHQELANQMLDQFKRAIPGLSESTVDTRSKILRGFISRITIDRDTGASVELAPVGHGLEGSSPYHCQGWLAILDPIRIRWSPIRGQRGVVLALVMALVCMVLLGGCAVAPEDDPPPVPVVPTQDAGGGPVVEDPPYPRSVD